MRNGVTNALVTCRVTGRVTVPRPDPTRPDPLYRAEVSIHNLRWLGLGSRGRVVAGVMDGI